MDVKKIIRQEIKNLLNENFMDVASISNYSYDKEEVAKLVPLFKDLFNKNNPITVIRAMTTVLNKNKIKHPVNKTPLGYVIDKAIGDDI